MLDGWVANENEKASEEQNDWQTHALGGSLRGVLHVRELVHAK